MFINLDDFVPCYVLSAKVKENYGSYKNIKAHTRQVETIYYLFKIFFERIYLFKMSSTM